MKTRQFGLAHLFFLTATVAAFLGLYQVHQFASLAVCPFGFGAAAGYRVSRKLEGAIVGSLAATYWSLLFGFLAFPIGLLFSAATGVVDVFAGSELPVWLFVICFVFFTLASWFGGRLGGKIALS